VFPGGRAARGEADGVDLLPLDGYLLTGSPSKDEAVAAVLAERLPIPAALPFYRALDLLGAKVADEALIALRLALAGRPVDDDGVRSLRASLAAARTGDDVARAAYFAALETV
jgi:hypothetical protein